jgi:hypothetical protein
MVVSAEVKVVTTCPLARSGEVSESNPSMTFRKASDDVETGGGPNSRDKLLGVSCWSRADGRLRSATGWFTATQQVVARSVPHSIFYIFPNERMDS